MSEQQQLKELQFMEQMTESLEGVTKPLRELQKKHDALTVQLLASLEKENETLWKLEEKNIQLMQKMQKMAEMNIQLVLQESQLSTGVKLLEDFQKENLALKRENEQLLFKNLKEAKISIEINRMEELQREVDTLKEKAVNVKTFSEMILKENSVLQETIKSLKKEVQDLTGGTM